jgi:uncharacterized membrane protein
MSHVVTLEYKLTDRGALEQACSKLGLTIKARATGEGSLHNITGLGIKLPNWNYDVIITEDGKVNYDNWNGRWGNQSELNKLITQYNYEVVVAALNAEGYEYVIDETEDKIEILTI